MSLNNATDMLLHDWDILQHSIRAQMTRCGRMGALNLDDGKARVELVIFSELFDANRSWLKKISF